MERKFTTRNRSDFRCFTRCTTFVVLAAREGEEDADEDEEDNNKDDEEDDDNKDDEEDEEDDDNKEDGFDNEEEEEGEDEKRKSELAETTESTLGAAVKRST